MQGDLDRAIAMAASAKGSYLLFATDSEDERATQVFRDMAEDMDRHTKILESRRDFLTKQDQQDQNEGGKKEAKQKQDDQN